MLLAAGVPPSRIYEARTALRSTETQHRESRPRCSRTCSSGLRRLEANPRVSKARVARRFAKLQHAPRRTMRQHHVARAIVVVTVLSNMAEPRYWAVMAWLIALIVVYCGFRELMD